MQTVFLSTVPRHPKLCRGYKSCKLSVVASKKKVFCGCSTDVFMNMKLVISWALTAVLHAVLQAEPDLGEGCGHPCSRDS